MSQNQNWFKSAFTKDLSQSEPSPSKKTRSSSFVDLTKSDDSNDDYTLKTSSAKPGLTPAKIFPPDSPNWMEHFAPGSVPDLAVHIKKIAEVQDWLCHYNVTKTKQPGQMLLISGPSGSGKTATVKALAAEMKYELVEWITPVDIDLIRHNQISSDNQDLTYRESQRDIFHQFLFKSSRYKSVFEMMKERLILVEDFPNVFIKDSDGFDELLQNYGIYGKSPLIFIVTDSKRKQLDLSYKLFPDDVKNQHHITHISFNPISTTLMKKALSRICSIMSQEDFNKFYKVPSATVVESINLASQGDIRNAIINLHFASQKGAPTLQTEKSSKLGKGNTKVKGKKLKSIGRDESITLMHALGRIFNPKYEENSKPNKLVHVPEDIADAFSSEPNMFVNFIHTNYLGHFSSIESALEGANSISDSDVLIADYREDSLTYMGLNIAVRGIMVSNTKPVSGWIPVKGFKDKKNKDGKLQEELQSLGIKFELSRNVLASDYRTYARIIQSSNNNSLERKFLLH